MADNYKNTSYTDKTVKCGESYYYTVRAYRKEQGVQIWGGYERPGILGQAAPAMVKSIKVSSANYKTLKITWSKVDGAQGYRIYRKKSGGSRISSRMP